MNIACHFKAHVPYITLLLLLRLIALSHSSRMTTRIVPIFRKAFLPRATLLARPFSSSFISLPREVYSVPEYASKYRDRPNVVILHGLLGSKLNFRSFAKLLHAPRVVNIDLRNHGDAIHTDASMTYSEMAADVVRSLEDMGLDRVALIGHSMGGKVAMTVALEHPERVSQLVSLDMPPVDFSETGAPAHRDGYTTEDVIDVLNEVDIQSVRTAKEILNDIDDKAAWLSPAMRAFLIQKLVPADSRANATRWSWEMNLPVITRDFKKHLMTWPHADNKQYSGPTFMLRGSQSEWFVEGHEKVAAQHFSNCIFDEVDAGHWLHSEKPFEVAHKVNMFLAYGANRSIWSRVSMQQR